MNRRIDFLLNKVSPTPHSLRLNQAIDAPDTATDINLGRLFLHKYWDEFSLGAPNPDPSSFEYLNYVSSANDFKFHTYIKGASEAKKREISSSTGQAFCRLMLEDHFGIAHFAPMNDVLNKPAHPAFGGMRVERIDDRDAPDYLCGDAQNAYFAEAKGRFSNIEFSHAAFGHWRDQFTRVRLIDSQNIPRSVKGYIVATKFVTDASSPAQRSKTLIEDPASEGQPLGREQSRQLSRAAKAIHYSRVFQKLRLPPLGSALNLGYALTRQLSFPLPLWTCTAPPFQGVTYIGGYYRTGTGHGPILTNKGWQMPFEFGTGHAVFIGLQSKVALQLAAAARGEWNALDEARPIFPEGQWSSDFAWLQDGTVAAPALHFIPTDRLVL